MAEKQKKRSYLGLPNQLLPTLEELSTGELRRFQSYLTGGQLPSLTPIPENPLERADRHKTVVIPQKYSPENAVKITVGILRRMKRKDLIEKLERYHRESTHASTSTLLHIASSVGQSSILTSPSRGAQGTLEWCNLSDEKLGSSCGEENVQTVYSTLTGPQMLPVPNLLLETLKELNTVTLKRFQWHLTEDVLDELPPIPESQLKNADWQDTVDQIIQSYGYENAVEITVVVLKLLYRNDLAEIIERSHREGAPRKISDRGVKRIIRRVVQEPRTTCGELQKDLQLAVPLSPYQGSREKYPPWYISQGILTPASSTISTISESDVEEEVIQFFGSSSSALDREALDSKAVDSLTKPATPYQFEPKTSDDKNKGTYRFQCPHAGLFQCSITGLVFEMEGEGVVLYWTVPWDRKLLAQRGKRPAGPLFKFTCPQGSVCKLHLPHCELYDQGGCEFLSVAHVTDDKKVEFIGNHKLTDTHVIINVTGFSKYGIVSEEGRPNSPIETLVLLFYQLPDVDKRSILKVLLLPSNVVLKEVREERRSSNGDREIYLETTSHCQLTPKQEYTLSTDLTDEHRIKPKKASFVDFQSYENYIPTFQLFMQSIVKEANIFLNENGSDTFIWDGLVWLPASPTEVTSTVSAPTPVTPSIPPGRAFIRKHRMALETRLGVLQPILLRLQKPDWGVLIDEEREEVVRKTTKTLQNQALLDMVIRKGARAQEHFYQALREADRCLVEDLEEQTA